MGKKKRVHFGNFFSKGQIEETLIWIILGVFALALGFILIAVLKGQGVTLADKIKSIIHIG
jgi:hypothetical protein